MEKISPQTHVVRFGQFELDLRAGELRKEGVRIKLQEQPFQVLAMFLEHPGQVVTREELRSKLWPADTFVDFDHGLNAAVNKIREALGDSAEKPRFVETLPRRGYRFLESYPGMMPEASASIAVLPFLNLSADPENELFADGMSEEIISTLMQIKNLRVVARTSAFSFKGKHVDLRTVGQQLNVRTVLEGSVRRSGDRLRITAQLVNAADGYHLWSQRYDREMQDMFAIQEDIAKSIAQTVTLGSERQPLLRTGTENLEAFKSYMQGRALFFKRGSGLSSSADSFKRAIALDSKYALAWSALADSYNTVGFYGIAPPEECLSQAKHAAERAIALDPSLSEAHTALAVSHLLLDWDRPSAEREFFCALELNPRNSLARSWYGLYFLQWFAGRFKEGLAQAEEAVHVDPLSPYARAMQSFAYAPLDVDKCLGTARQVLQIDPDFFLGRWGVLTAHSLKGSFAEAVEVGEIALRMSGRAPWVMGSLARNYAAMGKRGHSESLYNELRWRSKRELGSFRRWGT